MPYQMPLLEVLIEELEKLPGIGPKSGQRLALHILRRPLEDVQALAKAMLDVKQKVRTCSICLNYTDQEVCSICRDERRNRKQICVVADARDLMAIENSQEYRGVYHVLQGLLSPMEDVGPESLTIKELQERVRREQTEEIILATNPSPEGDATALYLAGLLKAMGVKVTRIALGLPVGGDLDYADQLTIARAISGRTEM